VIDRMLLTGWLLVVWIMLWGTATPAVLLSGLAVAPLCLAASRLPAVRLHARPRVRASLRALGRFLVDVLRSSAEVAWAVLRRGATVRSAILELPLPPVSDMLVSVIANRLSLVPGTLVVDIDRPSDRIYVYVLDVHTDEEVEQARQDAEGAVADVLAAAGQLPPRWEARR
jgi:multicomponent Na+:H+ antiporter subunit E